MSINVAAARQAGWERNAYLSCAVLIVYEHLLQFDAEVELFWKRRWTTAKAFFVWSRYYGLIYNISNCCLCKSVRHINCTNSQLTSTYNQNADPGHSCSRFFHWQNTGASLQVITTHLILELRLWAMYGSSRRILILLIILILGEAVTMGIVFGVPNPNLIATNEPFPGVFICADADPMDGSHWQVYYWVVILVIETVLLSLAVKKAWEYRSHSGNSVMHRLTRESVLYFATLFGIYLGNLIIWVVNRITLNEFGTPFSFVIASIFANRLLISARKASWHMRSHRTELSTRISDKRAYGLSDNIELTTCYAEESTTPTRYD